MIPRWQGKGTAGFPGPLVRASVAALLGGLLCSGASFAQQTAPGNPSAPTSLAELLKEAEANNPQLQAAHLAWKAAQETPTQVSTLPDPQFFLQQFSVGSPRPFAGYSNSDFAYVGLGVSQDLPYPGKLHLRGEITRREADAAGQQYEAARRSVLAEVKSAYFQVAYLAETMRILDTDGLLLAEVEKAADARYRSGMGSQQELLAVQLERTKLIREITMHHLDVARSQAQLKQALGRPQTAPDIEAAVLPETALPYTYEELFSAAKEHNPEIAEAEKLTERQKLQVDLAHKDFYPDFNLQYMWQRTDPTQYRAYYMLTFGVRVPIYRGRKQRPELAQAEAELSRSRKRVEAESQEVALELRNEYDTAQKTAELLKIYREGLLPQARAEFQAGLAAYQNNRQEFQALLAAFLDVLRLEEEDWQNAAAYETALARIEELSGLTLPEGGIRQ